MTTDHHSDVIRRGFRLALAASMLAVCLAVPSGCDSAPKPRPELARGDYASTDKGEEHGSQGRTQVATAETLQGSPVIIVNTPVRAAPPLRIGFEMIPSLVIWSDCAVLFSDGAQAERRAFSVGSIPEQELATLLRQLEELGVFTWTLMPPEDSVEVVIGCEWHGKKSTISWSDYWAARHIEEAMRYPDTQETDRAWLAIRALLRELRVESPESVNLHPRFVAWLRAKYPHVSIE